MCTYMRLRCLERVVEDGAHAGGVAGREQDNMRKRACDEWNAALQRRSLFRMWVDGRRVVSDPDAVRSGGELSVVGVG